MQAQVYGGADLGYVVNATRNMGFDWVKFQAPWKDFEGGGKGDYGWGGMDDIVNTLAGGGMKNTSASIVKAPNWSRNPAYGYSDEGPPQNLQDYADFVGTLHGGATAAACRPSRCGTSKCALRVGQRDNSTRPLCGDVETGLPRHQGSVSGHDRGQRRANAHGRRRRQGH